MTEDKIAIIPLKSGRFRDKTEPQPMTQGRSYIVVVDGKDYYGHFCKIEADAFKKGLMIGYGIPEGVR